MATLFAEGALPIALLNVHNFRISDQEKADIVQAANEAKEYCRSRGGAFFAFGDRNFIARGVCQTVIMPDGVVEHTARERGREEWGGNCLAI